MEPGAKTPVTELNQPSLQGTCVRKDIPSAAWCAGCEAGINSQVITYPRIATRAYVHSGDDSRVIAYPDSIRSGGDVAEQSAKDTSYQTQSRLAWHMCAQDGFTLTRITSRHSAEIRF